MLFKKYENSIYKILIPQVGWKLESTERQIRIHSILSLKGRRVSNSRYIGIFYRWKDPKHYLFILKGWLHRIPFFPASLFSWIKVKAYVQSGNSK